MINYIQNKLFTPTPSLICLSDKGSRNSNEDSIFPLESTNAVPELLIVSDGVGGTNHGKTASQLCNHLVERFFHRSTKPITKDIFNDLYLYLQTGFQRFKLDYSKFKDMATTTAILKIEGNGAHIGWAGDSRVYHIRQDKLLYRTIDHSLNEKFKDRMTMAGYKLVPGQFDHIILNGISGNVDVEHLEYHYLESLKKEDVLFLCSDGVNNSFKADDLERLLTSNASLEKKQQSIRAHCSKYATDNYSFILMKV